MAADSSPTVVPLVLAVGIAVLIVGLLVDPRVIAPIGGAIAIGTGYLWVRRRDRHQPSPVDLAPVARLGERYTRSRALERATLALGDLVGLGIALPAAGSRLSRRSSVLRNALLTAHDSSGK